jgi:protein gp37
MADTSIAWTDKVWNPVTGCTKVSEGCRNCYANAVADRFWGARKFTDVRMHTDRLDQPLQWRKPKRVFVNSMSDLFHEYVTDEFIDRVFAVMALAPQHTFQILTKRPHRMRHYISGEGTGNGGSLRRAHEVIKQANQAMLDGKGVWPGWPLPNVWLGVSCEDQKTADLRVPVLLEIDCAVRFLSCEPLIGPIALGSVPGVGVLDALHWVIVGGESGPGHRSMDLDWARSIRSQCAAARVPFFFKQGNGPRPGMGENALGELVQEFP